MSDDFHFLWGYAPDYWRGLRKHKLIDEHAGVRMLQCLFTPRSRCFNQWAAPGGLVHSEVWTQRRPLLIDRGCGGINYENYPFDKSLLRAYGARLGDGFLGVQFHEWVCNVLNDWGRISRRLGTARLARDARRTVAPASLPDLAAGQRFSLAQLQAAFDWRTPETCLETRDPPDFAGWPVPPTAEAMVEDCREYQRRKLADFAGYLTNVPSIGIAYVTALRLGARVVMPEHGHHIPMARVHTAAARGAVRELGRGQFGSYYAPWGNRPDSTTCYLDKTLWYTPAESLCGDAFKHRGNGGSSRAFQRRLFHWAYLTGARYIAEEWGPENTFFDWRDFDLTPYGAVVRDFMGFVNRVGRGELLTPAAVVIDGDWFGLDNALLWGRDAYWRFYPVPDHQRRVAEFLRRLIGHVESPPNDDARVLPASPMPDGFDIVDDSASGEFLRGYRVLAYIGEHPQRFLRKLRGYDGRVIMMDDPAAAADELTAATRELMPVQVEGKVNWLVTRRGRTDGRSGGGWQVALFNPHGVTVDFHRGEQADPVAAVTATVTLPPGTRKIAASAAWPEGSGIARRSRGEVEVRIGPGGLVVLEVA